MSSLSKKLLSAFLAGIAAVCLCLGAFFTVRLNASAETTLSGAEYFNINPSGTCTGLSQKGAGAVEANGSVKLVLPETVTSIGTGAFMGLSTVTEITLPDSIIEINSNAFMGCTSLSKVKLPENEQFTDIIGGLFNGCSSLFSITIPANVTYISDSAFSGCTRLVEVCNNSEVDISDCIPNALNIYNSEEGATKLQPADADGFVFYADEAKNPAEIYLIDYIGTAQTVTLPVSYNNWDYSVYNDAFRNDSFLTSINFPENAHISGIKDGAFAGTGITEITLPQSVTAIGASAFKGCASLENVTFINSGITAVASSVFEGCSKLESIAIPASVGTIGASAFKGCYALKTVSFNENLKTIESSAFEGCRSLEYIEIPAGVTEIQQNAFLNCGSLSTVYLPAQASFGKRVFDVASFGIEPPILIASNRSICEEYASATNLAEYVDRLTYPVEITLVYDGENHTDNRLHGFEYDYVLQEDEKTWAQTGGMPVQEGYKSSVWYKEAGYQTVVNGTELTAMLGENTAVITLYAKTEQKPTLTPSTDLVYSPDKEISFAQAVGWTETLGEKFNISISGYVPNVGTAQTPAKIKDAGAYVLSVTLKEGYGEWETPYTVTVTVNQAVADLGKLHWVTAGADGAELDSPTETILYLYEVDGKTVPYLDSELSYTSKGQKTVISSYLIYTGAEHTIVLSEDGEIEVKYFTGSNSATEAGIYTVTAEIKKNNNNYIFKFNSGADAAALGINVNMTELLSDSSDKVTISKTWYIVSSTTNGLVTRGGGTYNVPSILTYNGGVFTAPDISVCNERKEELVTFTLSRRESGATEYKPVFEENLSYSEFANVINPSIPVGDYEITFYIAQCENEKGIVAEVSQTFAFTVSEAPYMKDGLSLGSILSIGSAYESKFSGTPGFAQIPGLDKLGGKRELHSIPEGYNRWSGLDYADNYSVFEIYYNVAIKNGGEAGGYYTYDDYAGITANHPRISPIEVGVYTVYYRVSAPGYASVSGNYALVIYDEINIAEIQQSIDAMNILYNGEARKLDLDTDTYRAIYLDDETNSDVQSAMAALGITQTYDYINANEAGYPVALVINNKYSVDKLYRWDGWQDNPTLAYVKVMLKVGKADNNASSLTITEWEWNDYDPVKNAVSWSTDWVKDISAFTFELVPVSGGQKIPYADFGKADSGRYMLVATCPEGANYKAGSASFPVTISPAEIAWKTAPHLDSWKYGDFDKIYSVPTPVLKSSVSAIQEELINGAYFLREGSSERYDNIHLLKDENGELPAGKYELVYSRPAIGNYSKFDYTVSFQVLKADNYWDIAPVVRGWSYGDKSIDYLTYKPDCTPHYGDAKKVVVQYRSLDENDGALSGWEYTLADLGLDEYGKLNVGNYEIKATISGSENYENMEFTMTFKVIKAQNSWDEIPNVVSWNEGRIRSVEDFITAKSANGTVLITITDNKGKVIVEDEIIENINVNKLRSLGAGAYVLKAYVAESDRFDKLEAYVDFAVFEDSVSQTAIIVLTVIFAVIAIALAIVGVVLLVRRDRKIEEEFRKMIKAELNRR